ncbi:hypothetical protein UB45_07570 [Terrabacter sp. 28]|nr:hypothetical protein UB45_07570 [Terrabacter sp. 28]
MTLTEFLLARIAEDEHFGTHDRAMQSRLDRECKAKRRIVARHSVIEVVRHEDHAGMDDIPFCAHCGTDLDEGDCPDLLDLASVYADHPDCDEDWQS